MQGIEQEGLRSDNESTIRLMLGPVRGKITMESNNNIEEQAGPEQLSGVPSYDEYFSMNEQEKDLVIERAILRLQNRIRRILYLMEIENKPSVKPSHAAQPNDPPATNNYPENGS